MALHTEPWASSHSASQGLSVSIYKMKRLNKRTSEAPPPLPCSVSFNLINHTMVRGQDGLTDPGAGEQDTILTTLLDPGKLYYLLINP